MYYCTALVKPQKLLDFAQSLMDMAEKRDLKVDGYGNVVIALYGEIREGRYGAIRLSTKRLSKTGFYDEITLHTLEPDDDI